MVVESLGTLPLIVQEREGKEGGSIQGRDPEREAGEEESLQAISVLNVEVLDIGPGSAQVREEKSATYVVVEGIKKENALWIGTEEVVGEMIGALNVENLATGPKSVVPK